MEKNKEYRLMIGKRIEEFRQQLGMDQETLGQLSGIKQQTISAIEKGKFSVGIDLLGAIAKALGCTVELIDNNNEIV